MVENASANVSALRRLFRSDHGCLRKLYGVTVDDISGLSHIVASLGALPHKPTTRIVFDSNQGPAYYEQAAGAVHAVSYVLGEILDSSAVSQVSVSQYAQRTSEYLAALESKVDLWE